MSDDSDLYYHTTDFYTAAVLFCVGHKIKKVTREGKQDRDGQGKTRRFHFDNTEQLHQDRLAYLNNELTGNLRDFTFAIETVKELVHS